MIPQIGQRVLVTTNEWFFAPDGQNYKAVYGTVNGVHSDEATLGIKTNRSSTNWYLSIGNMLVAGCQVHYAIQSDECSNSRIRLELHHELESSDTQRGDCRIYFADTDKEEEECK